MTKPSASSTGIPAGTILKSAPAGFKPSGGGKYNGLKFKGQQNSALQTGQTATFVNCLFDANGDHRALRTDGNKGTIVLQNCELINATDELAYGSGFQILGSFCHKSGGDGFKPQHDCLIQGCYINDLGRSSGAHADGVQLVGDNTRIKVIGNFFDQVHDDSCNRNLMASKPGLQDIVWDQNWHTGRGYFAIQCYDSLKPSTIKITNNRFTRYSSGDVHYIPKHVQSGVQWLNNQFDDGTPC